MLTRNILAPYCVFKDVSRPGEIRKIEFTADHTISLSFLQGLVKGYIERFSFESNKVSPSLDIVFNEEGTLPHLNLPPNVYIPQFSDPFSYRPIVGPVVIVRRGSECFEGLTEDECQKVIALLSTLEVKH